LCLHYNPIFAKKQPLLVVLSFFSFFGVFCRARINKKYNKKQQKASFDAFYLYNENSIFFEDMRLEKYTSDVRNFGQAVYGAHKVDANERTSQRPTEKMFFGRER
jgi:hypothetical protein